MKSRRLASVAALAMLAVVASLGTARGQNGIDKGVHGEFCIAEGTLLFDIVAVITVEDDPIWGYLEAAPVNFATEYFRLEYDLAAGDGTVTNTPIVTSSSAPDQLADGVFTNNASFTRLIDGTPYDYYEVTWSGSIAMGTQPLTTSDTIEYLNAYDREFGGILVQRDAPITICEGPPVTTGAPPTTPAPTTTLAPPTTPAPTTTLAPPTTPAPTTTQAPPTTQAPTTTVDVSPSSTLPETGLGDAVRISAPAGLLLLATGTAALGAAALIGRLRRE